MLATSLSIVIVCLVVLIALGIVIALLKFFSSGTGVIVGFGLLGWLLAAMALAGLVG